MDFLGIGPLELGMIFLIILLVLGPTDMVKVGGQIGKFLRNLMTSETWRSMQKTSKSIRNLPNTLARQAGIDEMRELGKDMEKEIAGKDRSLDAWTETPTANKSANNGTQQSSEAEAETAADADSENE